MDFVADLPSRLQRACATKPPPPWSSLSSDGQLRRHESVCGTLAGSLRFAVATLDLCSDLANGLGAVSEALWAERRARLRLVDDLAILSARLAFVESENSLLNDDTQHLAAALRHRRSAEGHTPGADGDAPSVMPRPVARSVVAPDSALHVSPQRLAARTVPKLALGTLGISTAPPPPPCPVPPGFSSSESDSDMSPRDADGSNP
eukprot:TRINITY_DN14762_c0_g1_i1.p1 TRINITY_DN14762_c0_g1~~TRINITY_DN14762_c0_g1_i1.p1  ORF type:complete len:205 (+),score=16.41 TRINITY_DN14762_c0_g1_i1:93-707(+)